jgi:hypothetical protein
MLDDLDKTLRKLLIAEIPVKNGEIEISFDQPTGDWRNGSSKPAVNLFLYDVRENNILRQHQWERQPGNGQDGRAHLKLMPFRVDVTYMLTTWASIPEDEHWLLTRCMLALFRFPILPEELLEGELQNPPFDIQTSLARHDKLTNPAEIWSALNNEMRPSVSYLVTLALDPSKKRTTERIVTTRSLQTGQSLSMGRNLSRIPDLGRFELNSIGGTVRESSQDGKPLSGIQVAIKGTGQFATTDKQGRFVLRSVAPGEYTLIARRPKGKSSEKAIIVPQPEKEDDYDIVI